DLYVTGVQTCALPIWCAVAIDEFPAPEDGFGILQNEDRQPTPDACGLLFQQNVAADECFPPIDREGEPGLERSVVRREFGAPGRSEERRVGKECRARW